MASDYHIAQLMSRGKIRMLIELNLFNLLIQPIVSENLLHSRLITRHYTECGEQNRNWFLTITENKVKSVRFPVRPHAWVVGQVPSGESVRCNHTLKFLSLSFSLLSPLSKKE